VTDPAPAEPGPDAGGAIWTRDFILVLAQLFLFFSHITSFLLFPLYIEDMVGLKWVGWVMGAFPLGSLLTQPIFGRLCDRYGRRLFVLSGCAISLAVPAVMILWFSGEPGSVERGTGAAMVLMGLRFLHGAGVASASVSLLGAVADLAPPSYRGRVFMFSGVATLGASVLMPPTTEWIINDMGYTAYLGLAGLLAMLTAVPALFMRFPHHAGEERSGAGYRGLLARRNVLGLIIVCLGFALGEGALLSFAPVFIKSLDIGPVSVLYVAATLAALTSRIGLARLVDRVGPSRVIIVSVICSAVSVAAMGYVQSFWHIVIIAAAFGFSFGPMGPAFNTIAIEESSRETRGRSIALINVAYEGGYSGGAWSCGQIVASTDFRMMFASAALMMGAGLAGFLGFYRRRRRA